ncbi:Icc-related predicted phosphoesterase [Parabacteroides sp. PFB2-10]|uniref:metallophosphatase domain-containing protein n=1 Tax=Parabacteroides sp. PFB2-10 TaxID=1742405 RepID=UPI0024742EE6|nr:metallophosphatase domain-containing protein [Parabacteroides sp. PFB2-10]MDH6312403.1 Icc-related predicted phosphoesterase [Parabacteroides sp. PFB2-10]
MRLLHLSDTHNLHRQLSNLPIADIIIHSGDISYAGTGEEIADFVEWFGALDYEYKIFIAGNHDFCLENKNTDAVQQFLPKNCFYLCHSGVAIEGVRFWGMPFFFSDDISGEYHSKIAQVPKDTDMLISHRPPLGILDNANNINFGCPDLLQKVLDVRPHYHLFGHIHDAYGIEESKQTTFVNAALVDEAYRLTNSPHLFDI